MDRQIFVRAAEAIDQTNRFGQHNPCCSVLAPLDGEDASLEYRLFKEYFEPIRASRFDYWFGDPNHAFGEYRQRPVLLARKEHRVMALLFMQEIANGLTKEKK